MKKIQVLDSFWLKVLAVIFMTIDHIGLLFFQRGTVDINTDFYILRAIGKLAFPIFAFLAVESAFKTTHIKRYLSRLFVMAIGLDIIGFLFGFIAGLTPDKNYLLGNPFWDLFLGVLAIDLLRKKNKYSLFALIPVALAVLSDVDVPFYGSLFKADWGTFSIVLFLCFYLFRILVDLYLKNKAVKDGLEPETYLIQSGQNVHNVSAAVALLSVELLFYLVWRMWYDCPFLPGDFVPIGTYGTLASLFFLLYNGKRGYDNKVIRICFYTYFPLHLLILGLLSMAFGVLA